MYPKRLYSPTGGSITVTDAAHEKQHPGWSENPPAPLPAAAESGEGGNDADSDPKKPTRKR